VKALDSAGLVSDYATIHPSGIGPSSQAVRPFVRRCFPRSLSSDQRWTKLEFLGTWALWHWNTFCTGLQGTATAPLIL